MRGDCTRPSKWIPFIFGIIIMSSAGAVYGFSAYAQAIKSELSLRQSQIELLGELIHTGLYIGPVIGILVDIVPAKINFILAALFTTTGYFVSGMVINGEISLSLSVLGFLFFAFGFGSGLSYATSLTVNVKNFAVSPLKGFAVAILVSLFGFAAMIYTSVFNSFFANNAGKFLKFMAFDMLVVDILGFFFVNRITEEDEITSGYAEIDSSEDELIELHQKQPEIITKVSIVSVFK